MKYYRAVVYLEEDDNHTDLYHLGTLKAALHNYYNDGDFTIREFKETNVHKFNRAKDNEVKNGLSGSK